MKSRTRVTGCTPASFEPAIDYIVVKVPRWPFDKFKGADRTLSTSMKSTGEVMAIGRTLEEAFMKAKRSLDTDVTVHTNPSEIRMILSRPTDERFHCLFDAFREGFRLRKFSDSPRLPLSSSKKSKILLSWKSILRLTMKLR